MSNVRQKVRRLHIEPSPKAGLGVRSCLDMSRSFGGSPSRRVATQRRREQTLDGSCGAPVKTRASPPPQLGSWPRPSSGEIHKLGPKSLPKVTDDHQELKNDHVDGGTVASGRGLSPPSESVAGEREPRLQIAGPADEVVTQQTVVGFLLIDSLRRPIYANGEAARILLYPAKSRDDSSLKPLLGDRIRGVSERRLHPRHPAQPELGGKSIVLSAFLKRPREYLGAQLQNISRSGVCLLMDQAFEASQVLRCEILLPELPVRVATLLQVRWIERPRGTHTYRVGLQFVF